MLLVDAVNAIETVGGILLVMSAAAFIFLGVFVEIRRKSRSLTGAETGEQPVQSRAPYVNTRQRDVIAKTEKKPVSNKAPAPKLSRESFVVHELWSTVATPFGGTSPCA
jgi:heme/copper-type cytochrome/quinol oxidase subunit 1